MSEISKESPHTKMARAEFAKAKKKRKEKREDETLRCWGGECVDGGGGNAAVFVK